jgi:Xaa-Pro aminopeptidase
MPGPESPTGSTPAASAASVSTAGMPPADHVGRRARVRERLGQLDLDAALITEPVNVRWCSGFTGSNGQVLLRADAPDLLITDARYDARAELEAGDLDRVLRRDAVGVALEQLGLTGGAPSGAGHGSGAGVVAGQTRDGSGAEVVARPTGEGSEDGTGPRPTRAVRLGFEADHLTWHEGEQLRARLTEAGGEAVPMHDEVQSLRMVKDDHELAQLRRACDVTTAALEWLLDQRVAPGRTELELAVLLEQRFVALGADGVAFDTIVASGPNAAVPHHAPTDRVLEPGDVLTIDCGARVGGYHADCTRTVALQRLDEPLDEVYDVVHRAQAAGRAAAVAGATGEEVDAATRAVVAAAGYGEAFVHGTGHGVGLEIHEAPAVGRGSAATLEAGMTLTVEPGVYLPGIGGVRIEDTVVITSDGPATPLTELSRELRVL